MKNFTKNKNAFTMLELVFIIVVLGILASLAMPKLDRDLKQEASDAILSSIRYTQHLAIMDNKHKYNNAQWQRRFWHMTFGTCTGTDKFYMIGSDDDMTGSTNGRFTSLESAIDVTSGLPMHWTDGNDCSSGSETVSEEIFISKKYGIRNVVATGGCTSPSIGFDYLGRPHTVLFASSTAPDNSGYMTSQCLLTFTMSDSHAFSISIEQETGYAQIVGQNAS